MTYQTLVRCPDTLEIRHEGRKERQSSQAAYLAKRFDQASRLNTSQMRKNNPRATTLFRGYTE